MQNIVARDTLDAEVTNRAAIKCEGQEILASAMTRRLKS
jgi:hypothetical protein